MKKLILFLLTATLLVLPLSGCFADNEQNEGTMPNNTTENTTPEVTTPEVTTPDNPPEVTTPEVTTPDNPPEVTTPEVTTPDNPPEVTTPPENNQNNPTTAAGEELDKSSDLIVALLASLEELYKDILWPSVSFSSKIDAIKDGAQALHVVFNVNDYYFVCAYNSPDNEKIRYEDCTWVKYDNETDIQEYYNGGKLVEAFQINKTLSVIDILSGDTSVPNVEHFQPHYPIFENGVNVATPIVVNETFICVNGFRYLNVANDKTIYHYWGNRFELATISCVCLDGEYYLPFYLATLEDGEIFDAQQALSTNQITYTLGEYYDAIISVMDTEKYSVEVNEKYTYRYGVVSIDDFVNLITPDNPPEVTTPPDNSQGNNVPNNDDTSYVIVGTNASDEAMSQYALSAKIPAEWRIANGDILISLSFGLIKGCAVTDSTYSHILFWFENNAEQFFTFKKISIEEINKAEYIVEPIWDENREWAIGYTYTHIEDVILPLSIFSENSGIVWICMSELADGDISFESLGSGAYVALHYKKDGEKIIISVIASSN